MTKKEEAKRIAMGLRTDFKCESDTMVDFCNTVIKALEQEPCEDAISRQAVLEFLKGFEILHNHDELRSNLIYGIINLPPVTPLTKIDKIRDEIETQLRKHYYDNCDFCDGLICARQIIDKYKAEEEKSIEKQTDFEQIQDKDDLER